MRLLGYLLAACIACAVVNAVATVLALAVALAVIVGGITRPRETLGLLFFFALVSFAEANPGLLAAMAGMLAFASVVSFRLDRSR